MRNPHLRGLACGLLTLTLTAGLAGNALALTGAQSIQADFSDIKVMLDGAYLVLTDANGETVEPFAVNGTTYLPVRAVAGALGLNVEWQADTSTVALTSGGQVTTQTTSIPAKGRTIGMTLQADYSDIKVTLDGALLSLTDANGTVVEPFAVDGTTYLPVRAVSNALGLEVGWDSETSTVVLSSIPFTITGEEAQALVQGNLDELYLGKYDPSYLAMVDVTAEEAEASHLQNILAESEFFSLYWGIVMPENNESFDTMDTTIKNEIIDLITEIYSHAKYTVGTPVEQADGSYLVDVTVSPIDVVTRAAEVYDSGTYAPLNALNAKYTSEVLYSMTQAEYEAYSVEYANVILGLVREQMSSLGYLADQTVTMTISKDANGAFGGNNEDWNAIDTIIIGYPS